MQSFRTITEMLSARSVLGQKVALRYLQEGEINGPKDEWSYQRLDSEARRIAGLLLERTSPGERALLLYPPGLDFAAAFFGCLYAGVIAVPVYPPDPMRLQKTLPRLEKIIQSAEAAVVLSTSAILEMSSSLAELSPAFAAISWLSTDTAEEINKTLPLISPETIAFLQYTSGSTGEPKGVIVTHENLLHNMEIARGVFGHESGELCGVSWLPSYHDMGLIGGLLQPVYVGGEVTFFSPLDFLRRPLRWLEAISHYRATSSGAPDFAFRLCARKATDAELTGLDLSSWRVAFSGAEPVRADTLREFSARFAPCGFSRSAFFPVYGLAESTLIVSGPARTGGTILSLDASAMARGEVISSESAKEFVACGQVLKGLDVKIVDPITKEPCAPNRVGEIWIRGTSVAKGYWGDDEASEATFGATLPGSPVRYLRSGDLGFFYEGELVIAGRQKDLIIVRGRNHYPQDLESTAQNAHSALRPGCIAAFGIETNGEERVAIVAEVDPRRGGGDTRAVVAALRDALAKEHDLSLAAVSLLEPGTLPKTSSGKIQRYACRDGLLDGSLSALYRWIEGEERDKQESVQPSTTIPAQWASLAAQLRQCTATHAKCSLDAVQVDTTFSSLGMGSIELIELTVKLEDVLQQPLPTMTLYNYPSIASLIAHLDGSNQSPSAPQPIQPKEHIYRDLDKARERIDKRNQNYQFDLEKGIPWARVQEPGEYIPEALLYDVGINVDEVKKNPEAWELLQWSTALGVCTIFELFEIAVIFFCEQEKSTLGESRSLSLLCEEEEKHIQLFRRYAKHLRAQRPEDAKLFKEASLETERFALSVVKKIHAESKAVEHYLTWLWVLLFEEYTVYFHERLAQSALPIQPAWLSAHAAHRREETQHIITDAKHLESLVISPDVKSRASERFVKHVLDNFRYQFMVDAPARFLSSKFPGLKVERTESNIPGLYLKALATSKTFSHSVEHAPAFGALMRGLNDGPSLKKTPLSESRSRSLVWRVASQERHKPPLSSGRSL